MKKMRLHNDKSPLNGVNRFIRGMVAALGLVFLISAPAAASYTLTPSTWNIIGLDSNTPAFGPNRFPVGARVCGGTSGATDTASFTWDTGGTDNGTYIYLRTGSANPVSITFGADGCADAYFEVEVNPVSAAFDNTRRYHITAGGVSTPTPRELYVEHLVSQSRNAIDYVKLNGVSIPAGGSMNLMVGNTYTIELGGHTAPGGYNQFEEFINFSNTIFQIQSVSTDYGTNTSPYVSTNDHPQLYADACRWENDPNSPYYRSCWEDWKTGNVVITTYTVKIISGGGTTETLGTLLHDFSGSSFHYNADYSTGLRFANIIDPTNLSISKSFFPNPTNVGGVSVLTFTITNPNPGTVSGVNFTDVFPTSPGNMTLASTTTANTCGGTLTDSADGGLDVGDVGIKLTGGTVGANNNCTVQVSVTTDATGTYNNTSGNLYVDLLNTGDTASASLTVNTTPPPPAPPSACVSPVTLATWSMNDGLDGSSNPNYNGTLASGVSTATSSYTGTGTKSIDATTGNPLNSWKAVDGWSNNATGYPNGGVSPYFQFYIDTSNYGSARISFDYMLSDNQGWGGTNKVYIYSSANGGAYSTIYNASATKNSWQNNIAVGAAVTTGTSNTSFRINATASNGTQTSDGLYLDNVVLKGCPRPDPPSITKAFSPSPVAVNGTSTLTFTVTNQASKNVTQNYTLNGIAFTDTLPSGLTVATGSSTQCGGTLTTTAPSTISFTGGTLAANGTCNITTTVTATTVGPHNNVSGTVSATESGANTTSSGIASATLTAISPPSISKLFAPNPILAGGVSTLTFTITNPNQNDALNGVAFSDTFPATMVVASPTGATTSGCGAPTYAPVAATGSVTFSGGTVAAAGSCTVTVNVTVPATGTYTNTSGNGSHTLSGTWNGNTASDTLTVSAAHPSISVLKQVSTNAGGPWTTYIPVTTGSNVYYRFTVENPGDVDLTSVYVDDPAFGGTVCSPGNLVKYATVTCTAGPVTAVSGFNYNTATAYGTYGVTQYSSSESVAIYTTIGLTITKSVTETYFTAAGNVLNYSYVVKNTGYAPLLGPVTVTDDKATVTCPAVSTAKLQSDGTTAGDGDNYLDGMIVPANAEQITCTATYTVTAADVTAQQVTNVASAAIDGVTSPTDTETIPMAMPSLLVVKSVMAYSDPVNGTTSPKAIPGSFMTYAILVTNTGPGQVDNNTTVITDPIPANTEMFVGDFDGAGPVSGPLSFTDGASCSAGTAASGLSYSFINLSDLTDNLLFSKSNGTTYDAVSDIPTADANQCDMAVTHLKVSLSGIFNGTAASGGPNTSFCLQFRVRVK